MSERDECRSCGAMTEYTPYGTPTYGLCPRCAANNFVLREHPDPTKIIKAESAEKSVVNLLDYMGIRHA